MQYQKNYNKTQDIINIDKMHYKVINIHPNNNKHIKDIEKMLFHVFKKYVKH